jgi:hypothetical protein
MFQRLKNWLQRRGERSLGKRLERVLLREIEYLERRQRWRQGERGILRLAEVRSLLAVQGIDAGSWDDDEVTGYCVGSWAAVLAAMNECRGPVTVLPPGAWHDRGVDLH